MSIYRAREKPAKRRKMEMTFKPNLSLEEKRELANIIGTHLDRNGGLLLVAITGTSKTNMSYRLKVKLAYNSEAGGIDLMNVTYWLASELNKNMTDNDEIRFNGCGYDRVHDIAYTVALILERYGFSFSLSNMPRFVRAD
jgi:hypothetical protein